MSELSKAQFRVLQTAVEVGGLFRNSGNLWNWYRKHQQGYVMRVSGNATIEVLKSRGLLECATANTVAPTKAGREAIRHAVSSQKEPS